ncbi:MAG: S9 family peptidase [Pseudomonadales bacterium]
MLARCHGWLINGVVAIFCLALHAPLQAAETVSIPRNIETRNVPPIPKVQSDRLARYGNTRSAGLYGWQGDSLLIGTRFANTTQLHRVSVPLGMREQLTFLREPIAGVAIPSTQGDEIIVSWDEGGSEFDQLFLFNTRTGVSRRVSDGKSLYAYMYWSPDGQRFAYVTTARNGKNWDTHVQSLDGHVDKVLETDEGYWYPLGWHPAGDRLLMKHRVSVNRASIYELNLTTRRLTPLVHSETEEVSVSLAAYDGRGGLYYLSDAGAEFQRLHRLDLDSGEKTVITADVTWDVESFVLSNDRTHLVYVVNEAGRSRLELLSLTGRRGKGVAHRSVRLPQLPLGIAGTVAFSPDDKRIALNYTTATAPSDVYVIDIKKRQLEQWTRSEVGGLDRASFVDADLIKYTSFDGRTIPAFVYRPQTPGPHPVVIYIHGGPEGQYRPRFSTLMQSYVNEMNVAVIAPNVRGSKGYGKTYLKLDNGIQREDSVKDIGALLDWIDGRPEFISERVAVMGGSYGGYMVLASMVHFGNRLAAAVDSVGISNFVTFLENTQPYRQDIRRVEYGDERDPAMRKHLQAISPLNHVDKMVTPTLISQGANDPRVPASESEQIFKALEANGVPVWYVLAHDEGHGMRKKANRDFDQVAKFSFLEAYLNRE